MTGQVCRRGRGLQVQWEEPCLPDAAARRLMEVGGDGGAMAHAAMVVWVCSGAG